MLHYCVFSGLILSGMHLAWLMGRLLLLVSFPFDLFSVFECLVSMVFSLYVAVVFLVSGFVI